MEKIVVMKSLYIFLLIFISITNTTSTLTVEKDSISEGYIRTGAKLRKTTHFSWIESSDEQRKLEGTGVKLRKTNHFSNPSKVKSSNEQRKLDAKDDFYNLFDTAPHDWNANQWGFFASLMTVLSVAFFCLCCMWLPRCCNACGCLQDILLTLLCVEMCCDTSPRYNGFFC